MAMGEIVSFPKSRPVIRRWEDEEGYHVEVVPPQPGEKREAVFWKDYLADSYAELLAERYGLHIVGGWR